MTLLTASDEGVFTLPQEKVLDILILALLSVSPRSISVLHYDSRLHRMMREGKRDNACGDSCQDQNIIVHKKFQYYMQKGEKSCTDLIIRFLTMGCSLPGS